MGDPRIGREVAVRLTDYYVAVWTPDRHILAQQIGQRAAIWKFRPERR